MNILQVALLASFAFYRFAHASSIAQDTKEVEYKLTTLSILDYKLRVLSVITDDKGMLKPRPPTAEQEKELLELFPEKEFESPKATKRSCQSTCGEQQEYLAQFRIAVPALSKKDKNKKNSVTSDPVQP